MTELLRELEAVVAAQSNPKEWIGVALKFMDTHHAEIAEAARDAEMFRHARALLPTKVETRTLGDYSPEEMAAFDSGYNMALDRAHNLLSRQPGAIAAIDAHNSAREVGE